ncbi:glycosyltransferase family 4 protein [Vibrio vulnificus]|nr:glycosyltransferase family 4 protein [Vibrio vulnificus]EMA2414146.1 glycosyltransferase family 4 protein [Vibrio vulnificus]MCU8102706.1 glycosyltransferase family 4 protein [Vibrio vulnificus]
MVVESGDLKLKTVAYIHDFCFYKTYLADNYTAVGMPESYFHRFFESNFNKVKIYSRNKVEEFSKIENMGFSKIDNPNISLPVTINSYLSLLNPKVIRSLCKELRSADLLVINFPSIIGLYIWFMNLIIRKPYTLEIAADYDQFKNKRLGSIVTKVFNHAFNKVISGSKGAIFVSNYLKNKYYHPNSIVASNVTVTDVKEIDSTICNRKGDIYTILFVGGVNRRKGIGTLIDAVQVLVDSGNRDFVLRIVGGHSDKDYQRIVGNRGLNQYIQFLGLLNPKQVKIEMERADLYVQPSYAEGIPRATLEAMSFNLPVLATNLPGFEEILDSRCLVQVGDHFKLASLIKSCIKNEPWILETIKLNNKVISSFMFENLQSKRVNFYTGLGI